MDGWIHHKATHTLFDREENSMRTAIRDYLIKIQGFRLKFMNLHLFLAKYLEHSWWSFLSQLPQSHS